MNHFLLLGLGHLALASGIAALALLARRLEAPPRWVHALWLLVLLKLVVPGWLYIELPTGSAGSVAKIEFRSPSPGSHPVGELQLRSGWSEDAEPALVLEPSPAASGPDPALFLAGVWMTGALLLLHRSWRGRRRMGRLFTGAPPGSGEGAEYPRLREVTARLSRELSLPRVPRLLVLPGEIGPMVWSGAGGAVLTVSESWVTSTPEAAQEAVVAHELAHLALGHRWTRWFEDIVAALWWWCPLVWFARSGSRQAEEESCDEVAMALVPGSRTSFARALIEAVPLRRPGPGWKSGAMALGAGGSLERRIRRLFSTAGRNPESRTWSVLLLVLGMSSIPGALVGALPNEIEIDLGDREEAQIGPLADPRGLVLRSEAGAEPLLAGGSSNLRRSLRGLDAEVVELILETRSEIEAFVAEAPEGALAALADQRGDATFLSAIYEASPARAPSIDAFLLAVGLEDAVREACAAARVEPSPADRGRALMWQAEGVYALDSCLQMRRDTIEELRSAGAPIGREDLRVSFEEVSAELHPVTRALLAEAFPDILGSPDASAPPDPGERDPVAD